MRSRRRRDSRVSSIRRGKSLIFPPYRQELQCGRQPPIERVNRARAVILGYPLRHDWSFRRYQLCQASGQWIYRPRGKLARSLASRPNKHTNGHPAFRRPIEPASIRRQAGISALSHSCPDMRRREPRAPCQPGRHRFQRQRCPPRACRTGPSAPSEARRSTQFVRQFRCRGGGCGGTLSVATGPNEGWILNKEPRRPQNTSDPETMGSRPISGTL